MSILHLSYHKSVIPLENNFILISSVLFVKFLGNVNSMAMQTTSLGSAFH